MNLGKSLALCVLLASTSGCVTIAGNALQDLPRVTPLEKPRVEQTIGEFSFHLDGGKMITSIKAGRYFNAEVLDRWKKWGYISSQTYVKSGAFSGGADYEITLGGTQDGDSSIVLQILSGLTLYAIPHYVDTRLDAYFDVKDRRTGATYRADVSDSFNTVISLLMIPFSPFAQGGRTRTWDRIAANLYQQLLEQGAFGGAAVAPPNPQP